MEIEDWLKDWFLFSVYSIYMALESERSTGKNVISVILNYWIGLFCIFQSDLSRSTAVTLFQGQDLFIYFLKIY